MTSDLTSDEIDEAFQTIRDNSAVRIHPLIDATQRLLLSERATRRALAEKAALLELNGILRELGEAVTTLEEVDRAGVDLANTEQWSVRVPDVVRDGLARHEPDWDLLRDMKRGK